MKKNFNTHAQTYDKSAFVQKKAALELTGLINKNPDQTVYEIGCGTGNLSINLIKKIKPYLMTLNDICPNMIKKAKDKIDRLNADTKINYIQADIEKIKIKDNFDLICSSSVFQWIKNLNSLFVKIKNTLKKEGSLAFSMFTEGTFKELDSSFFEAYKNLNLEYEKKTIDFYKAQEVKNYLINNGFKIRHFKMKNYAVNYKSVFNFLKEIKNIGASDINEKKTDYKIIKKMMEIYNTNYKNNSGNIKVSYKVLFCIASV